MIPDYAYAGLALNVVRDETLGLFVFGVELDGAFVPLYTRKLGGIDADIARAKTEQDAATAQAAQTAIPQTPPPGDEYDSSSGAPTPPTGPPPPPPVA